MANEAASNWLNRLELLREAMSEHDWPVMDDQMLAEILTEKRSE